MGKTLVFLAAVMLISGCDKQSQPNTKPETRPAKLLSVSVGDSQFSRNFPAVSEAGDKAALAFRVSGQIQSIQVKSGQQVENCLLYTSPSPRDRSLSRMPSSA